MKLFEFQAKEAFAEQGIPIPAGMVATNREEVLKAVKGTGLPCMIKAQVLRGGRGKAGLIKRALSEAEAVEKAEGLFNSEYNVRKVLVEAAVDIDRELYMAVTYDPVDARAMFIACAEGGVEIEKLAAEHPDTIVTVTVDMDWGLMPHHVRDLTFGLGLEGETAKAVGDVARKLFKVFRDTGAELAEINPLFIVKSGGVIAGDGKLNIDDCVAGGKYPVTREYFDSDTEYEAALEGIPYIPFDGDIALMCGGAGLTTTVYDLVHYAGGSVAAYVEFGGPNYTRARDAMRLCLKKTCKVLLVVTFGTIARADVMATGLVEAIRELKPAMPIVTCIRGTNEEEAFATLRAAGIEPLYETEEAVQRAVAIAAGRNA
ncbi:MAG: acetate--CoA ligase family protein [Desulfovibrio sp.]|jgi:succinyl-CoA synthetase beta subunit|nr:acetate--CoA ligase family protein [Desulfovibrio sp.]